ncbi:hypothetical protein Tco_0250773 [Tanacetum coccineum]
MTDKDSSAAGSKPMTPFVHTRPANNEVHKKVWKIKEYLTAFEPIIQNGRAQPCWSEYRRSFVNEIIPFYENIKNLSQNLDTDIYTEVKEFERSLDKMESDYDKCLADNKRLGDKNKHLLAKTRRLQRVMTNLSNDNECFIADNIAKDICSFVLSSEKQVSPRSNCSCKELQSNYDKGHSRVVALEAEVLEKQQMLAKSEHQSSLIQKQFVDLQLKFQNYKERLQNEKVCVPPNATASNAIVEINQLKYQLQRKDDTIRNLETHINITRMLNVGPTTGSLDQQALETEVTQLKDALTSLRIQNDGYKIENANVNRRYLELSTASTHSRTTLTGKMAILNAEIAKLKAEAVGKKNSGPTELVKPKVLASMMYTKSSKYIVPPKRANWVQPTPLPKKKQVTFQDPHRSSPRPAQKPQVQQHKKPTVPVNVFQKPKPATVARKPNPKNNFRNHSRLPTKSVKARRAADYYRNLYVDIGQFVVHSTKSVHVKTHQARRAPVNTSKKAWKSYPRADVARLVPQWEAHGFVGRTVADSSTARLKQATTYVFRWFDLSLLSRTSGLENSKHTGTSDYSVQYCTVMVINSPGFMIKQELDYLESKRLLLGVELQLLADLFPPASINNTVRSAHSSRCTEASGRPVTAARSVDDMTSVLRITSDYDKCLADNKRLGDKNKHLLAKTRLAFFKKAKCLRDRIAVVKNMLQDSAKNQRERRILSTSNDNECPAVMRDQHTKRKGRYLHAEAEAFLPIRSKETILMLSKNLEAANIADCHLGSALHLHLTAKINALTAEMQTGKLSLSGKRVWIYSTLRNPFCDSFFEVPQAKHSVNHTKKVWKATRYHNVNTTKTAWRPTRKVVGSVKPQWKPTGRHFALYDNCPLTRIMEPIVEPLELTPSVSSSSKVTMISRFTDCNLSDRKAGSKGLSGIFEC